jgi:hypothetical protein
VQQFGGNLLCLYGGRNGRGAVGGAAAGRQGDYSADPALPRRRGSVLEGLQLVDAATRGDPDAAFHLTMAAVRALARAGPPCRALESDSGQWRATRGLGRSPYTRFGVERVGTSNGLALEGDGCSRPLPGPLNLRTVSDAETGSGPENSHLEAETASRLRSSTRGTGFGGNWGLSTQVRRDRANIGSGRLRRGGNLAAVGALRDVSRSRCRRLLAHVLSLTPAPSRPTRPTCGRAVRRDMRLHCGTGRRPSGGLARVRIPHSRPGTPSPLLGWALLFPHSVPTHRGSLSDS